MRGERWEELFSNFSHRPYNLRKNEVDSSDYRRRERGPTSKSEFAVMNRNLSILVDYIKLRK